MSWQPATEAECLESRCTPVATVIVPKAKDIGAFEVRRALPSVERRAVGPFVFLDQFGPATIKPGNMLDVRPHPHIGLATVSWLLDGEIMHRDSLGYAQVIRPGEVNWMTAGRGIVHSERTPEHLRGRESTILGVQAWLALPADKQEIDPAFEHFPADCFPTIERDGATIHLIAGDAWGERSPVTLHSETFYAQIDLSSGATAELPTAIEERGIYLIDGTVEIAGETFEPGRLIVFKPGEPVWLETGTGTRMMALGGAPLDGPKERPRHLYWNFVSTSKERIEQAKDDWRNGRFGTVPGDEDEFIPLPD
ncbi:MAG: pirin family protein [Rhodospirillales bacterium]